jgi:hypothetical protein
MIIDRHNYEEFFILYWDNELSAAQKLAVEDFVKQNADLHEEFKILGETRFTPDNNTQFEEKEFLQNGSSLNITNYEEQLFNYIDDELSNEERKDVEKAVSKYPVIEKELSLLQKTKLQPESIIVFPDKSSLYRREEKVRVIGMTWFRVAVAAVIILIAGLITFRLVNSTSGDKNQVATTTGDNKPEQATTPSLTQPTVQPQKVEQSLVRHDQKSGTKERMTEKKNNKPIVEDQIANNTVAVKTRENKNNLPIEGSGKIISDPINTIDGVIADVKLSEKKDYNSPEKNGTGAINTSLGKSDVTNNTELALYIPKTEEKEKGSLKEFLRKTTRVFERRTKIQTTTEDNKLLVGAFAVSLK